jgi:hypothetical protein
VYFARTVLWGPAWSGGEGGATLCTREATTGQQRVTQQADGPPTPSLGSRRTSGPPSAESAPSLSQVMARAGARPVGVAGLRPCYKYPARRSGGSFGGLGLDNSFTDTLFRSAPLARQQLALPYEPVCRLAVSQADWLRFPDVGTTRRRAWAAFGQPGGAFEMSSAAAFQELSLGGLPRGPFHHAHESWMLDSSLPSGGELDEYCSVVEPREHPAALDLVQLLTATVVEYAADLAGHEQLADAKVVDETVPAACVHWRKDPLDYSLSVTARVHGDRLNGLKFWGVFWNDDEVRGVRWVYKALEVAAPGVMVTKLDELGPDSEHSGRLMTIVWQQFDALRALLLHKAATDCFSEAVRCLLMV